MKSKIKEPTQPTSVNEESCMEDEGHEYQEHEISSAAEDLLRAESLKEKPKLHGHAMEHLKKKHKSIGRVMGHGKPKSIADLKALAKKAAIADE